MEVLGWIGQNWFEALQSAGIVAGLVLTALALRQDVKVRRISNLIAITAQHRDIWNGLNARPELSRVLDPTADIEQTPVTTEEDLFITMLILHLYSVYRAIQEGLYLRPEGLGKDIAMFFALPVVKTVWGRMKLLQDKEFVRFIETCLG